jgi:hypothetical protein
MKCRSCGITIPDAKAKCELCGFDNGLKITPEEFALEEKNPVEKEVKAEQTKAPVEKPNERNASPQRGKHLPKPTEAEAIALGERLVRENSEDVSAIRRAYRYSPKGHKIRMLLTQKLGKKKVEKFIGKEGLEKMEQKQEVKQTAPATAPAQKKELMSTVNEGLVYSVIDMLDEQDISRALSTGAVSEKWCYSFNMGGKEINGISFEGAKQLAILTGGVAIDSNKAPQVLSEDDKKLRVGAYAGLVRDGKIVFGIWGTVEQSKWFNATARNDKAYTIACSKAQRNALLSVIPEGIRTKAIAEWKKQGRVHKIDNAEFKQHQQSSAPSRPTTEIKFGEANQ